jgi:hypothetical protein
MPIDLHNKERFDPIDSILANEKYLSSHPIVYIFKRLSASADAFDALIPDEEFESQIDFCMTCMGSTLSMLAYGNMTDVAEYGVLCMMYAYFMGRTGQPLADQDALAFNAELDIKTKALLAKLAKKQEKAKNKKMDEALANFNGPVM